MEVKIEEIVKGYKRETGDLTSSGGEEDETRMLRMNPFEFI